MKQAELCNNSLFVTMDEVDVAMHIQPLVEAVKDLREQLNVVAVGLNSKIDALADMLTRQSDTINRKVELLMERTQPKSNCLFCLIEDNKDCHPTGRCCRYPDAVSRAVRASNLNLCNRCLQPRHREDCGILCTYFGREHNVLLCPSKLSQSTGSLKRKKF
uniref:t-SNARE coiled-coil homology domain-containing protein n=1 Tax=Haemonchus contortus TaxID=6289 RepID=A0A7I4YG21_HAECO